MWQDPGMANMQEQRVGVIDVGSNSVRLVIFQGPQGAPNYFFNEKVLCGLGAKLAETGRLSISGRERALDAIGRFSLIAERMRVDRLIGIATAAVRDAEDGLEFVDSVKLRTGLHLKVVTGAEEGRLSARGVVMGFPDATGLAIDMGGASMEVTAIDKGNIGASVTSDLGPLQLRSMPLDAAISSIARTMRALRIAHPGPVGTLYLVGGSWRAIAGIDMARRQYPLPVLQGYKFAPKHVKNLTEWIARQDVPTLKSFVSTSSARLALLGNVAQVLAALTETFSPDQLIISAFGLREGVLYERMDQNMRRSDPLLTACAFMEQSYARTPGFAEALFRWLQPVLAQVAPGKERLVAAACYLHDIHWTAHPDVRQEFAFEAVCRANLAGIDHTGRVFLAAILAQRYKTGNQPVSKLVLSLIDERARQQAAQIGNAIRLGAMLTGGCAAALEDTRIDLSKSIIKLTLGPNAAPMMGEATQKRLERLAKETGRKYEIRFR